MKENVIDVLMYILKSASLEEEATQHDHETLKTLLMDAGFNNGEIHEAFRWLDNLGTRITHQPPIEYANASIRHFSSGEVALLDTACRDYLLGLANTGILTANSFELVIDQLYALDSDDIDLDDLEWVVLIVLSNQADQQIAFQRLEAMTFHEPNLRLN